MKSLYYIVLLMSPAWMRPPVQVKTTWMRPPAHLRTAWGGHTAGPLDTNAARAVLDSPLLVTDDQGGVYTVTRFQFSYRQIARYEDSTGKVITSTRFFSKEFYDSPVVDTLWRDNISAEVQPGEAYIIDHVVVKNAKGVKALAPGLELDVQ